VKWWLQFLPMRRNYVRNDTNRRVPKTDGD
jgi:hypothetical protein